MIGCIIQARMGSARLPGKVMKKIDGEKPTISYLIEQLEFCKSFDDVVVATTNLKEDDVIEKHVRNMRIKVYRGDPLNVLDRYYNCAKINSYNTIVRITCDNPFVDPILVDKIVTTFSEGTFDYVSNTIDRTFPHGTEVEVFSYSALERAWKKAEKQHDKLKDVGNKVHERLAEMPFWEDYDELIESDIADIKNVGGSFGGAITAGKFLAHFTDYPWIHLDIAGVTFVKTKYGYRGKGATGMGVRLLYQFIKNKI